MHFPFKTSHYLTFPLTLPENTNFPSFVIARARIVEVPGVFIGGNALVFG